MSRSPTSGAWESAGIQRRSNPNTVLDVEALHYIQWINSEFSDDNELSYLLPLDGENAETLANACRDGYLLAKLLVNAHGSILNLAKIYKNPKLDIFKIQNVENVLEAAKSVGIKRTGISSADIVRGNAAIIVGLIWQIIKNDLLGNLKKGSLLTDEDAKTLEAEAKLLAWLNTSAAEAGFQKQVTNMGADLSDSVAIGFLMNRLTKEMVGRPLINILDLQKEPDLIKRADIVLSVAEVIGCLFFASSTDIVTGNSRMNMAFVAVLYNTCTDKKPRSFVRASRIFSSANDDIKLVREHVKESEAKRLSDLGLSKKEAKIKTSNSATLPTTMPSPTLKAETNSANSSRSALLPETNHRDTVAKKPHLTIDPSAPLRSPKPERSESPSKVEVSSPLRPKDLPKTNSKSVEILSASKDSIVLVEDSDEHLSTAMRLLAKNAPGTNVGIYLDFNELKAIKDSLSKHYENVLQLRAEKNELSKLMSELKQDFEEKQTESPDEFTGTSYTLDLEESIRNIRKFASMIGQSDDTKEAMDGINDECDISEDAIRRIDAKFGALEGLIREQKQVIYSLRTKQIPKANGSVSSPSGTTRSERISMKEMLKKTSSASSMIPATAFAKTERMNSDLSHRPASPAEGLTSPGTPENNDAVIVNLQEQRKEVLAFKVESLTRKNQELENKNKILMHENTSFQAVVKDLERQLYESRYSFHYQSVVKSNPGSENNSPLSGDGMEAEALRRLLEEVSEKQTNVELNYQMLLESLREPNSSASDQLVFFKETNAEIRKKLAEVRSQAERSSGRIDPHDIQEMLSSLDIIVKRSQNAEKIIEHMLLTINGLSSVVYSLHEESAGLPGSPISPQTIDEPSAEVAEVTRVLRGLSGEDIPDRHVFKVSDIQGLVRDIQAFSRNKILISQRMAQYEDKINTLVSLNNRMRRRLEKESFSKEPVIDVLNRWTATHQSLAQQFGQKGGSPGSDARTSDIMNLLVAIERDLSEKVLDIVFENKNLKKRLAVGKDQYDLQRQENLGLRLNALLQNNTVHALKNESVIYKFKAALRNDQEVLDLEEYAIKIEGEFIQLQNRIMALENVNKDLINELKNQSFEKEQLLQSITDEENLNARSLMTGYENQMRILEGMRDSILDQVNAIQDPKYATELKSLTNRVGEAVGMTRKLLLSVFQQFDNSNGVIGFLKERMHNLMAEKYSPAGRKEDSKGYFLSLQKSLDQNRAVYEDLKQKSSNITTAQEMQSLFKEAFKMLHEDKAILKMMNQCAWYLFEDAMSKDCLIADLEEENFALRMKVIDFETRNEITEVTEGEKIPTPAYMEQRAQIAQKMYETYNKSHQNNFIIVNAQDQMKGHINSSIRLKTFRKIQKLRSQRDEIKKNGTEKIDITIGIIDDLVQFLQSAMEQQLFQDSFRNYLWAHLKAQEAGYKEVTKRLAEKEEKFRSYEKRLYAVEIENYKIRVHVDSFVKETSSRVPKILGALSSLRTSIGETDQSKGGLFGGKGKRDSQKYQGADTIFDEMSKLNSSVKELAETYRIFKDGLQQPTKIVITEDFKASVAKKQESIRKAASDYEQYVVKSMNDYSKVVLDLDKALEFQSAMNDLIDAHKHVKQQIEQAEKYFLIVDAEVEMLKSQKSTYETTIEELNEIVTRQKSEIARINAEKSARIAELDPSKINSAVHISHKKEYINEVKAKSPSAVDVPKLIGLYSEAISELESLYGHFVSSVTAKDKSLFRSAFVPEVVAIVAKQQNVLEEVDRYFSKISEYLARPQDKLEIKESYERIVSQLCQTEEEMRALKEQTENFDMFRDMMESRLESLNDRLEATQRALRIERAKKNTACTEVEKSKMKELNEQLLIENEKLRRFQTMSMSPMDEGSPRKLDHTPTLMTNKTLKMFKTSTNISKTSELSLGSSANMDSLVRIETVSESNLREKKEAQQ